MGSARFMSSLGAGTLPVLQPAPLVWQRPEPGQVMIHATVTLVASAGRREGILRALRSLLGPTRVEPGCLGCSLREDVELPGRFTLEEQWATGADFTRRLRSE